MSLVGFWKELIAVSALTVLMVSGDEYNVYFCW